MSFYMFLHYFRKPLTRLTLLYVLSFPAQYPSHSDLIQVHYLPGGHLISQLQSCFCYNSSTFLVISIAISSISPSESVDSWS